jgi:hypothetical protein
MDFNFFENDILNMNLNKIVRRISLKNLKIVLMIFSRIFQKYSKNISPKVVTRAVKK